MNTKNAFYHFQKIMLEFGASSIDGTDFIQQFGRRRCLVLREL